MRRRALAGLGCGLLVLAGCSGTGPGQSVVLDSGQAAVSSEFRVSQEQVADESALVLSGLGRPPGDPEPGLAVRTTERLVLNELIDSYAAANGLQVTRTEIEQGLQALTAQNGGQEALENLALQSGIPLSSLEDTVRTNLLVSDIGSRLDASGDPGPQVEAARVALTQYSEDIEVAVAPRYGTWDDERLAIVPDTALSQPVEPGATG